MNSPVYQAERHHSQHSATEALRSLSRLARRVFLIMFGSALLITTLLLGMELLAALNSDFAASLLKQADTVLILAHYAPSIWLIHVTLFLHFLLLLQIVMVSSDTILREKRGGTWELLILTSQTPSQIVLAKWWAAVRENLFLAVWVSALRFGAILYLGLERYRVDYFNPNRNPADPLYDIRPLPFHMNISTLLLGAALIGLFTFANLGFTAAIGVMISALKRSGNGGERFLVTFVARSMLLVVPAILLLLGAEAVYNENVPISPPTTNFLLSTHLSSMAISLVDNGTLASSAFLTAPRYALNFVLARPYTQFFPPSTIPLVLAFYALLSVAALKSAVRLSRRSD